MKEIHGRRNWPWWRSQIIQIYRNDTWIWQKTLSFGNDRYTVDKDPYDWCLRQSKRLMAIDPHIKIEMRNHKLLNKLSGDAEHAVKFRLSKESTLDEISTTLQECESPNQYAERFSKDREEIFEREKETRKDQEVHESDSDSVGNGCEHNHNQEYLVEFKNHEAKEIGSVHLKIRKPTTKHLDGLKHKPPDK
ncbi:hypothetical protein O181_032238 [Austropuccinia psidii MF-1]|uniref:Uncharacterized protein n=1 Tax=Austropuccinia psidii MF-1 TaxID=1389203 RepID=A0A9Q3D179_9BASI|nr:hypothetical protein [Austropuccinia psidii MF-1]